MGFLGSDSDDLSMDEIIRQARDDRDDVVTIKRTPNKVFRPLMPKGAAMRGAVRDYSNIDTDKAVKTKYKRTMRCGKCNGCCAPNCQKCSACRSVRDSKILV